MKNAVIIAEYNPFHNGHKYQVDYLRAAGAETVSVIMNGDHTQCGQPMLMKKHERAKIAIMNGVDLVLELPFRFGTSSAEYFARGAIDIANSFMLFDTLCFGSECGNIDYFFSLYGIFQQSFSSGRLSELISSGLSYPVALSNILKESGSTFIPEAPNDILGFEYIKALFQTNSKIKPMTIKRSVSYNGEDSANHVVSASAIRNLINSKKDFFPYIPENCFSSINQQFSNGNVALYSLFERVILSLIRQKKNSYFKDINQVFNRINKFSNAASLDELYKSVKNKSCTMSSVKRAVLHYAFGFNDVYMPSSFLRVLAFNDNGRKLLAEARNISGISVKHTLPSENEFKEETEFDALSSDLYGLYCGNLIPGGFDYKTTSFFIN